MSLTSHQRPHKGATDIWLTPPEIIMALGPFDLDPCAAVNQPWQTADIQYTIIDDGLAQEWEGFVWCNPPFGPDAEQWLRRMSAHNNGIALVPARTETRWFKNEVWRDASCLLFLATRPHFHHIDGTRAKSNSGAPIVLVAYGDDAAIRLRLSHIPGALVEVWKIQ